jgi:Cu+-exporting ATPase
LLAASIALTIPAVFFTWFPILPTLQNNILLLFLVTPVQFVVGWTFYVGAYKGLRNKTTNMDTLIAMGTSTAWIYSAVVTFAPSTFPGAGVFLTQPQ